MFVLELISLQQLGANVTNDDSLSEAASRLRSVQLQAIGQRFCGHQAARRPSTRPVTRWTRVEFHLWTLACCSERNLG